MCVVWFRHPTGLLGGHAEKRVEDALTSTYSHPCPPAGGHKSLSPPRLSPLFFSPLPDGSTCLLCLFDRLSLIRSHVTG